MKEKIKAIFSFAVDVVLIYSVLVMIFIALAFLYEMAVICLPLLILALAIKVIPMVSQKKEDD